MATMTEQERKFYKKKMKEIKQALKRGDEAAANRHANELQDFLGLE